MATRMLPNTDQKRWLVAVIVLVCALATFLYARHLGVFKEHRAAEARFNVETLRTFAQKNGVESLVARVKRDAHEFTNLNGHQIGHSLGQVLYEREGLDAMALCSDAFTYGCLHQVIGLGYAEGGQSAFEGMVRICKEQSFVPARECLHALGHGIVYFSDYKADDLERTLLLCDTAQSGVPFDYEDSCYGGAFMEYNMHFMSDNEGAFNTGRPYDASAPLSPCSTIPTERDRATCAFWLLPWYHGQLDHWRFNERSFRSLGDFCDTMTDNHMHTACMLAIGREAAVNVPPERLTLSLCAAAADSRHENDMCLFGAARINAPSHADLSSWLCERASATRIEACKKFSISQETIWPSLE